MEYVAEEAGVCPPLASGGAVCAARLRLCPPTRSLCCWKGTAQRRGKAEGARHGAHDTESWTNYHIINTSSSPLSANMTATVISPFPEYREASNKVTRASREECTARIGVFFFEIMLTLA